MKILTKKVINEVLINLKNNYSDNYDLQRFGSKKNTTLIKKIKYYTGLKYCKAVWVLSTYKVALNKTYALLENNESKKLFVKLLAYKILGYKKVKLPLSTPDYWENIFKLNDFKTNDYLEALWGSNKIKLYRYDLDNQKLDLPIKIYYTAKGLNTHINSKQYRYKTGDIEIRPELGDIVLDCGACYGDTALFFANEIGENGFVYSFDFINSNIDVFEKNVDLNTSLKKRISLISKPVGKVSNINLRYIDNGPGSRICNDSRSSNEVLTATTIAIDDFTNEIQKKIDFIKMDIEGAELDALKGAVKTIRKFKPKLAISIYHSLDDFVNIPIWIDSLNLGYKLYLGHYSIHNEETVIYAKV